jgi:hypothetical protein
MKKIVQFILVPLNSWGNDFSGFHSFVFVFHFGDLALVSLDGGLEEEKIRKRLD